MQYFQNWSGGKDSTASIILEHIHSLPKSTIIFSEVIFDKNRGISGESPEHIEWVHNTAIPIFEKWGYKVKILHSEFDYLDVFHRVKYRSSKYPEDNGKLYGFLLGGMCNANRYLKLKPIKDFFKKISGEYVNYVGIATDEPKRLERLKGTKKISLLEHYGYTEQMAFDLCSEYGLLSPIYKHSKRGGCWFCPNATLCELAHTKKNYPELWAELERLSHTPNLCVKAFKYGASFAEIDEKVDAFIERENAEQDQLRLEDY